MIIVDGLIFCPVSKRSLCRGVRDVHLEKLFVVTFKLLFCLGTLSFETWLGVNADLHWVFVKQSNSGDFNLVKSVFVARKVGPHLA